MRPAPTIIGTHAGPFEAEAGAAATVSAMRLLAVRHGESTWNAMGRWQGQADPDLSELGARQAFALGRRLAGADLAAVISSDLGRALQTARAIAGPHGLEVEVRPDLRERDVGTWTGLTRAEIVARHPDAWAQYRAHQDPAIGGGETNRDLHARIAAALEAIVVAADPLSESTTVVVGHGGTVRAMAYATLGLTLEPGRPMALTAPANTAVSEIGCDRRGMRLHSYNDTAHLLDVGSHATALDS